MRRFAGPVLALAVVVLPGTAPAQQKRPIVVQTKGVEPGKEFACRIPVEIHYRGKPPLMQVRVIAQAYEGKLQVASTGVTTGRRPLIANQVRRGVDYVPVPLQFSLSAVPCGRIDQLRITYASCVFGSGKAEPCKDRMRFREADPTDPLLHRFG